MAAEDLDPQLTALEGRISELTGRVHRVEQDTATAHALASGVARAVAELRTEVRDSRKAITPCADATRRALAALRTQTHDGFIQMHGEIDTVLAGNDQVIALLNTLIARHSDQPGQGDLSIRRA
jgi:hypothetical protein